MEFSTLTRIDPTSGATVNRLPATTAPAARPWTFVDTCAYPLAKAHQAIGTELIVDQSSGAVYFVPAVELSKQSSKMS